MIELFKLDTFIFHFLKVKNAMPTSEPVRRIVKVWVSEYPSSVKYMLAILIAVNVGVSHNICFI